MRSIQRRCTSWVGHSWQSLQIFTTPSVLLRSVPNFDSLFKCPLCTHLSKDFGLNPKSGPKWPKWAKMGPWEPKNRPNSRPEHPTYLHSMKCSDAVNFCRKSKLKNLFSVIFRGAFESGYAYFIFFILKKLKVYFFQYEKKNTQTRI